LLCAEQSHRDNQSVEEDDVGQPVQQHYLEEGFDAAEWARQPIGDPHRNRHDEWIKRRRQMSGSEKYTRSPKSDALKSIKEGVVLLGRQLRKWYDT
jgi:hypothetical protein